LINWKAVGCLSLGIGSVTLIWGLIVFLTVNAELHQIPYIGQIAVKTALIAAVPHFIATSFFYVVGGIGLYLDKDRQTESVDYDNEEVTEDLLDRLDRLEEIFDNNFSITNQRLDKIEEKQNMLSQNTLIKTKKE
jgi:hypothetical protein